jgi:lactate dehydrogenase-like 2-hydroxyacid dehydrogenase
MKIVITNGLWIVLIKSSGRLKHIARLGVGVESIDLQSATGRGIIVTNTPDLTRVSRGEVPRPLVNREVLPQKDL